ncbi:MAG: hypothetical protein V1792_11480 [Pseudomonadota bacterium]
MKKPFAQHIAASICFETLLDPIKEWMQGTSLSSYKRKRETECFVVSKEVMQPSAVLQSSSVRPTRRQKEEFERLAEQWRNEVMFLSDTEERITHPAYERIISMGRAIVPLLLRRVQEAHEHWFYALERITGEDPVDPEDVGNVENISRAWVEWGRSRGLLHQ